MKKKFLTALLAAVCITAGAFGFSACGEKDNYTPEYVLEKCSLRTYEFNNIGNEVTYDKMFSVGETVILFDEELTDGRIIDKWIDRISRFAQILNQKEFGCIDTVYISDKLIANFKTENGQTLLSFKTETAEEEAFAWILQAVSDNPNLPYGVFAGLAVELLDTDKYSSFVYSSIGSAGYLTELQYPLYETANLPEKERAFAWSFSRFLVKDLMSSGKTEKRISSMDIAELNLFLQTTYKISLPDYAFFPYSTKYEYRVEQGCFTYYINREFTDIILPKSCFSSAYNHLSDWLKDNGKTTEESNSVFGVSSMYDISVYLDDGLKSTGISGEAGNDYILIYSAGSFSHEYIHHILYLKGNSGNLREVFTELHANTSKYSNLMYYYLISGEADVYPYPDGERQTYEETLELYEKLSGFPASPDNFDYWLFSDCFSAIYTKKGEKFISRAQSSSMIYYIARVYGSEYLFKLNMDGKASIDGKTTDEVIDEWINYLQTIK